LDGGLNGGGQGGEFDLDTPPPSTVIPIPDTASVTSLQDVDHGFDTPTSTVFPRVPTIVGVSALAAAAVTVTTYGIVWWAGLYGGFDLWTPRAHA
jgi:hypothetical protein